MAALPAMSGAGKSGHGHRIRWERGRRDECRRLDWNHGSSARSCDWTGWGLVWHESEPPSSRFRTRKILHHAIHMVDDRTDVGIFDWIYRDSDSRVQNSLSTSPTGFATAIIGLAGGYTLGILVLVVTVNRGLARIREQNGTQHRTPDEIAAAMPAALKKWQYPAVYDSKHSVLGIPLLSIRFNGAVESKQRACRGLGRDW